MEKKGGVVDGLPFDELELEATGREQGAGGSSAMEGPWMEQSEEIQLREVWSLNCGASLNHVWARIGHFYFAEQLFRQYMISPQALHQFMLPAFRRQCLRLNILPWNMEFTSSTLMKTSSECLSPSQAPINGNTALTAAPKHRAVSKRTLASASNMRLSAPDLPSFKLKAPSFDL